MANERLQRILAAAGIDSRRNCEQLIVQGAVRVNGKIVDTLPAFADAEKDIITVDGRRIQRPRKVYFLLNKPKGVICTNEDPGGRRKAIDLIDCRERIFCAGRLDTDTTGALILTNDSVLADRLTHPKYNLEKTYLVTVRDKVTPEIIEKIKKGVWLSEGKAAPSKIKVLKAAEKESTLEIKIKVGMNREIQRIMARFGFKIRALKRTHIGRISIERIAVGGYRQLTSSEIDYLKKEKN
ncbi:MAG: Ribosomal large subunit pseudouridine synthase B [Planctomycetes bacterium ADurb.Bin401]|nr:MAG: Ribosomal large subunit pseudouridine synthase B [Planctomycetes bacterium ADurb.Bin401]